MNVKRRFSVRRKLRGRKGLDVEYSTPLGAAVPRVARLMALAIRFDQLIRDGIVDDQAELARLGHVSRARVTQLFNLINLAPDIQEGILSLQTTEGRNSISERNLRPIAAEASWRIQRRLWHDLTGSR